MKKHRRHKSSAELRAKLALDTIKNQKTLAQRSKQFAITITVAP